MARITSASVIVQSGLISFRAKNIRGGALENKVEARRDYALLTLFGAVVQYPHGWASTLAIVGQVREVFED
jgi:hypothetical protein